MKREGGHVLSRTVKLNKEKVKIQIMGKETLSHKLRIWKKEENWWNSKINLKSSEFK